LRFSILLEYLQVLLYASVLQFAAKLFFSMADTHRAFAPALRLFQFILFWYSATAHR